MAITKSYFNIVNGSTASPDTTMVLIGTALDGPVNTPFTIPVGSDVYKILGISPLGKAYVQAYNTGVRNIIIYRLNGKHSEAKIPYRGADLFKFRAVGASDLYNTLTDAGVYNNIKVYMDDTELRITTTLGIDRRYLLQNFKTASKLVDQINLDAAYGLIEVEATTVRPNLELNQVTIADMYTAFFEGGSAESTLIPDREHVADISSTLTELKKRLKSALFGDNPDDQLIGDPNSMLGLLDYGGIVLVDMFYDDDPEFATILGTFSYNKSLLGHGCLGVIGTKPVFDITRISDTTDRLMRISPASIYPLVIDPNSISIGREITPLNFIQVVVGDTLMSLGILATAKPISLAYAYLGTQLTYPYHCDLTNKTISGITGLSYEFSKEVVDKFLANGYISIVSSIRRRFVPYAAITAVGSKSKSSYKNPHYVRISQNISRLLTNNLDNLVGQVSNKAAQNNLNKRVEDLIQTLVDEGVIRSFSVHCEYVAPMYTEARVQVSFTPFLDVHTVSSVTIIPYTKG